MWSNASELHLKKMDSTLSTNEQQSFSNLIARCQQSKTWKIFRVLEQFMSIKVCLCLKRVLGWAHQYVCNGVEW